MKPTSQAFALQSLEHNMPTGHPAVIEKTLLSGIKVLT
jgi:hypothetical protein